MNYDWDAVLTICAWDSTHATRALAEPDLPLDDLLRAAPLPDDGNPYGRTVLHSGDLGEILLIRWRPDTFCAPHDHGESRGFVRFLVGSFVERSWEMVDGALISTDERSIAAPAIVEVSRNAIHSMKSTDGGISLHCYFPAVAAMRVYDTVARETLTLRDDCGAWIPKQPERIISRKSWSGAAA